MERTFNFNGKTYIPIGNILGGFFVKNKYFSWKKTIEYSSWDDFMKIAKKNKAKCDIFKCLNDGNYYIPTNKCLALIDEKVFNTKHFKSIEKYSKWYK